MVEENIKRFSTSLSTREMGIKTTKRHHFIPTSTMVIVKQTNTKTKTSIGKDVAMEYGETGALIADGILKW